MSRGQPEPASSTRITDLPSFLQSQTELKPKAEMERLYPTRNTDYQPINDVHPNPYGVAMPAEQPNFTAGFGTPFTGGQPQGGQAFSQMQPTGMPYAGGPDHMLPSRDIPRDVGRFLPDEQVQPNYIPKPKLTRDFVQEYDEVDDRWHQKKQQKHRKLKVNDLFSELQLPMFLAFLFFLFQLPAVNTFLVSYCTALPICEAGTTTLNLFGFVLKGLLFALVWYLCMKFMDTFIE
jgi:hypothetical protein